MLARFKTFVILRHSFKLVEKSAHSLILWFFFLIYTVGATQLEYSPFWIVFSFIWKHAFVLVHRPSLSDRTSGKPFRFIRLTTCFCWRKYHLYFYRTDLWGSPINQTIPFRQYWTSVLHYLTQKLLLWRFYPKI